MAFYPQTIVRGAAFLDRKVESDQLENALRSGVNTLLIAPRRYGKSSLIQHVLQRLEKEAICLYVDAIRASGGKELAQLIIARLFEETAGPVQRAAAWLQDHLPRLQVSLVHEATGTRVEILGRQKPEQSLSAALEALGNVAQTEGRRVVLAIDEFQAVLERGKNENVAAAMRTVIQHQNKVSYIFSGSKQHVLLGMVEKPVAPFWGQLEVMELQGIPFHHFRAFARRSFKKDGRVITEDALDRVQEICGDNPKRVQDVLSGVFREGTKVNPKIVDEVAWKQIQAQDHVFRSILDDIPTPYQVRLLRGLATESKPRIFSAEFTFRYDLGIQGNVQYAARALRDRGIIDKANRFTDPFFEHQMRGALPPGRS